MAENKPISTLYTAPTGKDAHVLEILDPTEPNPERRNQKLSFSLLRNWLLGWEPIAQNQYGTHPAFSSIMQVIVWLLQQTDAAPVTALTLQVSQNNITAYGGADGTITATPSGGSGAYNFQLNDEPWTGDKSTPHEFTGLSFGTDGQYVVRLRDAQNHTSVVSRTVELTQPAAPVFTLLTNKSNVTTYGGNNGSISANAINGTPPYQYSFNGGSMGSTNNWPNLSAGTYNIGVRDAEGKTDTKQVVITQPAAPAINAYYGWKDDIGMLLPEQIQQGTAVAISSGADITADYRANNLSKYLWMAEPVSEPIKTKWYGTEQNKGNIGGEEDLFYLPTEAYGWRFYITAYKTKNTATPIQFRKA